MAPLAIPCNVGANFFCDKTAIQIASNPVFYECAKNTENDCIQSRMLFEMGS